MKVGRFGAKALDKLMFAIGPLGIRLPWYFETTMEVTKATIEGGFQRTKEKGRGKKGRKIKLNPLNGMHKREVQWRAVQS